MGYIIKPPTTKKFDSDLEHIPQSHFVKKTEKEAVTKHIPKEEPEQLATGSIDMGETPKMFEYTPTSSYNPTTFSIESSYKSVMDAIETGKDTDLVAMPVGEVRRLQERIRILEREVMKSPSGKHALTTHLMMEKERMRIQAEQQRITWEYEHKKATELRKNEIKRDIERSRNWENIFNSK